MVVLKEAKAKIIKEGNEIGYPHQSLLVTERLASVEERIWELLGGFLGLCKQYNPQIGLGESGSFDGPDDMAMRWLSGGK